MCSSIIDRAEVKYRARSSLAYPQGYRVLDDAESETKAEFNTILHHRRLCCESFSL